MKKVIKAQDVDYSQNDGSIHITIEAHGELDRDDVPHLKDALENALYKYFNIIADNIYIK